MSSSVNDGWPTADLGPLRRLEVVASTAKSPVRAERRFDVPPEELWTVISDLENELPRIVTGLRSFTLEGGEGDRRSAVATSSLGHRERFGVVLRPGWCLMQSRALVTGMAAAPEGAGTRFAFFSALRFPGGSVVARLRSFRAEDRAGAMLDRLQQRIDARSLPGRAE